MGAFQRRLSRIGKAEGRLEALPLSDGHQRVLDYVRSQPGCNKREVADALNLSHRTVASARNALSSHGLIVVGHTGTCIHLLPFEPGLELCWRQVVALRDRPTNQLHGQLLARGMASLQELTDYVWTLWKADKSFVRRRLADLRQTGLTRRVGPCTGHPRYAHVPVSPPALAVLQPGHAPSIELPVLGQGGLR